MCIRKILRACSWVKKEMTVTLCLSMHHANESAKRITSFYMNTSLAGLIKDLGYMAGYRILNANNIECMWYRI